MGFIDLLKKRRSIYAIGDQVTHSKESIETAIQNAIKKGPSAFNSQSSRAVILFNDAHQALWSLTKESLRPLVGADNFDETATKIESFAAGYGTVLFFEDQSVIEGLQDRFALYADNFPRWSEQSTGIAQFSVWLALTEMNLGATIQHYNPIIDEKVMEEWDIPNNWKLTGQMPFGSIEAAAAEKSFIDESERFMTFR